MAKLTSLIDKEQIATKIREFAVVLDREYADRDLVILMVLKGAVILTADLIRALQIPCDIEVIQCQSYGTLGVRRGELTVRGLDDLAVEGRDVLVVDDIFDSGHTLSTLFEALRSKHPRSLKSLVLLHKKAPHATPLRPDYVLFHIENRFVVGYGLDYKERYRGLPGVYMLEEE